MKNYYEILGVKKTSSHDQIKTAFRNLAKAHHPDKNPDDPSAEAKFKEVGEAYGVLSDSKKKQEYDLLREGGRSKFRRFDQDPYPGSYRKGTPFEDLHEVFRDFDVRFRQGGTRVRKNRDINLSYSISLEDAFSGKQGTLSFKLQTGQEKQVDFDIPAGIDHGQRIRYPGMGDNSDKSIGPGDLLLTIYITRHPKFQRTGPHLALQEQLDVLDAILGKKVEITTIDGSKVKLTIPSGTQPGQLLRVAGKGMPTNTRIGRGDLYIEMKINIPKTKDLNKIQVELLKKVRDLPDTPEMARGKTDNTPGAKVDLKV